MKASSASIPNVKEVLLEDKREERVRLSMGVTSSGELMFLESYGICDFTNTVTFLL